MRSISRGLAALLLFACASPLMAAEEALDWLQRMHLAASQPLQGSFVYERAGSFSTHNVWRQVDARGQLLERLLQTDGAPLEQVRADGRLLCSSSLHTSDLALPVLADVQDVRGLTDWYAVQVLGSTRVASRAVTVIGLKPRDAFRYAHELYLDSHTGLLLKALMINERNHLLERFQFVELSDQAPSLIALQGSSACLGQPGPSAELQALSPGWHAGWLPGGFRQIGAHQRKVGEDWVEVVVYGDGLARFSLFVEPVDQQLASGLQAQLGPTLALSRVLERGQEQPLLVTLIGEIPTAAAERILAGVELLPVTAP